jgi:hypothetical protein
MRLFAVLALVVGCAGSELSAEDQLTLTAISGEEEAASRGELDGADLAPAMFRDCDAHATFTELFDRFDADRSGELERPECHDVEDAHTSDGGRAHDGKRAHGGPWRLIHMVYDVDEDHALDDAERAVLLDDFTVRCEVLHERLLEEFDADGDGDLDDTEREAAHEAMRERMEGHRADRPQRGDAPHLEFDADGDGELDETERSVMRATLRERIRAGLPMHEA